MSCFLLYFLCDTILNDNLLTYFTILPSSIFSLSYSTTKITTKTVISLKCSCLLLSSWAAIFTLKSYAWKLIPLITWPSLNESLLKQSEQKGIQIPWHKGWRNQEGIAAGSQTAVLLSTSNQAHVDTHELQRQITKDFLLSFWDFFFKCLKKFSVWKSFPFLWVQKLKQCF